MPIFGYNCLACSVEFEELLVMSEDVKQYRDQHPCPSCGEMAPRIGVSQFSFAFKGAVKGTSGIHGNSGVHDWDYPTLDKAVARSSEAKWSANRERQAMINKVRKENNTHAVSMDNNGNLRPTDSSVLEVRQKAIPLLKKMVAGTKTIK